MNVTVVGAGAIGSVIAASLARGGQDVLLVDGWYRHLRTIERDGLRVETPHETFVARPGVVHFDALEDLGTTDRLIVAVKSYDTAWVADLLRDHLAPDGIVLSAQNGMNEATLASVFGEERTAGCVVAMGAECFTPGHVRRTTSTDAVALLLGELRTCVTSRLRQLADLLDAVGGIELTDDIMCPMLSKLTLNVMSNPLGGLSGQSTGVMWTKPHIVDGMVALAHEAAMVASAAGFEMTPVLGRLDQGLLREARTFGDDSWCRARSIIAEVGESRRDEGDHLPSLLHDVIKGRRTEIDYLNGWVVGKGRECGVPTPVNEICVRSVHDLEIEGQPSDSRLDPLLEAALRHHGS